VSALHFDTKGSLSVAVSMVEKPSATRVRHEVKRCALCVRFETSAFPPIESTPLSFSRASGFHLNGRLCVLWVQSLTK